MEAIGIIFFACLAFAIAIVILITCCFFKVNGGKNANDLEMSKSANDRIDRIRQMAYDKTNDGKIRNHNQNVILFLQKKHQNDATLPKQDIGRSNRSRRIDDVDGIDEGYQNGEGHQNGSGQSDHCNSTDVQATTCHPTHDISNHGHHSHEDSISHQTGLGHYNSGFSSHFSGNHGGGWGHHSGSGHHGHDHDDGHDNDGDDGDD